MPNPYFRFKQFTVFHDQCAMKVGIDGVLLGAWAPVENAKRILDVGTGTGLIALILAQRSNAAIIGIDIDQLAILQATENIRNSPWPSRLTVMKKSFQEYSNVLPERFDLIVSNPPFFINSTKTPIENRTAARHTDSLTHEELIENAISLLKSSGRICIILPVNEGLRCINFAESKGLYCTKQVTVFPKPGSDSKRLLVELSLIKSPKTETELVIESEVRHQYSTEFIELVKDFYLKL